MTDKIVDFRNFVHLMWDYLNLTSPTPVQYDIAHYLQHGPRRRMVQAFRGVGKSWITAGYVLWRLQSNPEERILVVSASKDRADAFSIFVKRLINEMPMLQHLKPREGQRDSNIAFDVGPSSAHQAPSVRSVGITGQLTGGRATLIIADDIETPRNSLTHAMRFKLAEAVKEFDAVLVPDGEVVWLGTPQTEQSLYNLLPERGYTLRVWPARYPDKKLQERYADRLAPFITERLQQDPSLAPQGNSRGKPTDPRRFGDTDLIERELSYGRSGFAMQFQLDTAGSDSDRHPLKLSDLVVMACSPTMGPVRVAWGSGPDQIINDLPNVGLSGDRLHRPMFISKDDFADYQGVVMSIDPSGRGGDELGYAIVSMLMGNLFVLDVGGLTKGYTDENLALLVRKAKQYGVKEVVIESNFGDGMFTKMITPFFVRGYPVTVTEVRHSTQKEKRIIDTMEPLLNQHRVVFDSELVQRDYENTNDYPDDKAPSYQLLFQLTRITRDRGALAKDDRLDALAMAFAYWVEQMDKDVQSSLNDHRSAAMDVELTKFMGGVLGGSPKGLNWCS